jgi:hypothetical protein
VAMLASEVVLIGYHKDPSFYIFKNKLPFLAIFSFSTRRFDHHFTERKIKYQKRKWDNLYFINIEAKDTNIFTDWCKLQLTLTQ